MSHFRLRSFGRMAAAAAILSSIGATALAQNATTGKRIEEVIVTAERKEASIQDTSISITAFTGDMLDDFGIRNQEDLQNYIPATTIQPYDATIRGVGRNFRALGGDPGVATYMNGIYSEDLLTATAATFWDVERIEVLRGPQGTLYGRNAVGGAINILYNEPTEEFDFALKGIAGNFDTQEWYGMVNVPLMQDKLYSRFNYSHRDRDGVIDDIGPYNDDLDGLGTDNYAALLKFTPTDTITANIRYNDMRIKRSFGGANGGGLVVLNEMGLPTRNTTDIVPGLRAIDTTNTDPANFAQNSWYDATQPIVIRNDPDTGVPVQAQANRLGVDIAEYDGLRNSAASLDGFGVTSAESAARYNDCVFPGSINGDDVCAATNGLNQEKFDQQGIQFNLAWDVSEKLQLKYLYGHNQLSYQRTTDDDNTASAYADRQFYVNHEAKYSSNEFQAFYDVSDSLTFTSGIFFYDATIDQRGDFYSSVGEARFIEPYNDVTGLDTVGISLIPGVITSINLAGCTATGDCIPAGTYNGEFPTLHSARALCQDPATAKEQCQVNYAQQNPTPYQNNNLHIGVWEGDHGQNGDLNVSHGPDTLGSDLLYHTQTKRKAFAAYTQGVWDINQDFTLTFGLRYARDKLKAQENLFRYGEVGAFYFQPGADGTVPFGMDIFTYNLLNGGVVPDATAPGGYIGTEKAVNGGLPAGISVYRPFNRVDKKWTGRLNLDWNVNDSTLLYLNVTSGFRSGGNNLVFFSSTPAYDPEELIAYEFGYKFQFLDDTLQINGAFFYYDYETIHTTVSEVTQPLTPGGAAGSTTSVLPAPGGEVYGAEAEATWLVSDRWTLGGNFSYTPSEYTKDLWVQDPADVNTPESLFPQVSELVQNINGNQILQVPDWKYTAWTSYRVPVPAIGDIEFLASYNWIDEVYYSPFQSDEEKADSYGRLDLRATWNSPGNHWLVTGFVNNVFDDVGNLQILRGGEDEFFRHSSGTTVPRLYGVELTYTFAN